MPEEERREAILEGAFRVAIREHLGGLSMRAVAEEAGVSKGLVFFHFQDKETLLRELLDWVLEGSPRVDVPAELAEAGRLPELQGRVELFLDFWVLGTVHPELQERIRDAFRRYRAEFLPFTRPVAAALPERFDADAPEGLAAGIVSFIQGCALQLIADPREFDVDRYMRALRGLVLGG
jgi:AcrR family transcriptional regulator